MTHEELQNRLAAELARSYSNYQNSYHAWLEAEDESAHCCRMDSLRHKDLLYYRAQRDLCESLGFNVSVGEFQKAFDREMKYFATLDE